MVFLFVREKMGPGNPEDPFNKILDILDTGAISSWKHEMIFGKYSMPIIDNRIIHYLIDYLWLLVHAWLKGPRPGPLEPWAMNH